MFPIRDHNPSERTPFVTYALIGINVVVFLTTLPLFQDDQALVRLWTDYALVPGFVSEGRGFTGLFTSMFLHAGWLHLIGNMLFLWIFGDNMEDAFGHVGFLLFYLAAGIGAGLVHVAVAPGSMVPTIGASGAIAGVLGGYLLLYPKARVDIFFFFLVFFKIIPVPAWLMLGVWFALQVLNSGALDASGGGVAYWAHIGGFVFGLLFTLPYWLRQGAAGFWKTTGGRPDHPARQAEYPNLSRSDMPVVRRSRRRR
jgi:rhomboid family protein